MNGDGQALSICNNGITKIMCNDKIIFAFDKSKKDILYYEKIKPLNIVLKSLPIYTVPVNKDLESIVKPNIQPLKIKVKNKDFSKNPILDTLDIKVISTIQEKEISNIQSLESLNINVYTDRPPINQGSGNNDGLKSFKIVTQKNNYFEFKLNMGDDYVTNIIGLPYGVSYYDGCLKGSAQISGEFLITVYLSNNTTIDGTLIVSQLPRKF